jgi:hypothetical protein
VLYYAIPSSLGQGNIIVYRLLILGALPWKGGSAMSFVVTIDWKSVVALGLAAGVIILCTKMTPDAAERVSIHAVDACKEFAVAGNGNQ